MLLALFTPCIRCTLLQSEAHVNWLAALFRTSAQSVFAQETQ